MLQTIARGWFGGSRPHCRSGIHDDLAGNRAAVKK